MNQRLYGIQPPDLRLVGVAEQARLIESYFADALSSRDNWLFTRFIKDRIEPLTLDSHIFHSDAEFRADFYYAGGDVKVKMPGSSSITKVQFDSLGTIPAVDLFRSPGVSRISRLCYQDDHIRFNMDDVSFAVKPLSGSESHSWGNLDLAGDFVNSAVSVLRVTNFGANLRNIVQPFDNGAYTLSIKALCES